MMMMEEEGRGRSSLVKRAEEPDTVYSFLRSSMAGFVSRAGQERPCEGHANLRLCLLRWRTGKNFRG